MKAVIECRLVLIPSRLSVFAYLDNFHGIGSTCFPHWLSNGHNDQVTVSHHASLEQFVLGVVQYDFGIVRAATEFYWVDAAEQRHLAAGILLRTKRKYRNIRTSARHQ